MDSAPPPCTSPPAIPPLSSVLPHIPLQSCTNSAHSNISNGKLSWREALWAQRRQRGVLSPPSVGLLSLTSICLSAVNGRCESSELGKFIRVDRINSIKIKFGNTQRNSTAHCDEQTETHSCIRWFILNRLMNEIYECNNDIPAWRRVSVPPS
jgi:hypothetical protein